MMIVMIVTMMMMLMVKVLYLDPVLESLVLPPIQVAKDQVIQHPDVKLDPVDGLKQINR